MSNFLKPINSLPVAESIYEGDKILINSGGVAKQIDASLVGGSGGGKTIIYVELVDGGFEVMLAYKDPEHTQQMTYAEGKAALESGAIISLYDDTQYTLAIIAAIDINPDAKIYSVFTFMNISSDSQNPSVLVFSDSVLD